LSLPLPAPLRTEAGLAKEEMKMPAEDKKMPAEEPHSAEDTIAAEVSFPDWSFRGFT
jgi:hypothetical protein